MAVCGPSETSAYIHPLDVCPACWSISKVENYEQEESYLLLDNVLLEQEKVMRPEIAIIY